eukprot:9479832-Pyramimonas_sp.AAC.1
MAWQRPSAGGASAAQTINESTPNVKSLPMLEGPKAMPWHGIGNNHASAAAGARFETNGSAEMRPAP